MLNSPLTTPQFSRILWCAALLMLCCFSGCSNARMADDKGITKTENYNGRDYIFYTPIALAHSSSPLLIILHGGGGSAEWMQRHLSMEAMANRYGFKLAYLNGNPGERFFSHNMRTWNAGDCCGIAAAKQLDDVGYLTGFINHLVQQGEADASRISLPPWLPFPAHCRWPLMAANAKRSIWLFCTCMAWKMRMSPSMAAPEKRVLQKIFSSAPLLIIQRSFVRLEPISA